VSNVGVEDKKCDQRSRPTGAQSLEWFAVYLDLKTAEQSDVERLARCRE
jgi:hypothetical protein